MDSAPRSPNGFLSSLTADDFELIRPHLRTADLSQDMVLVEVDETLKRAYLPHKGVISLVVKLARGEHVQIAMIGRDSIFGAFAALGDPVALNTAVVLVPGVASTIIGARRMDQIEQNLAALDLTLSGDQIARLDKLSKPILSFPNQFLNVAGMFSQGGTTVNGEKSTVWPLAPKTDAERY